MIVLSNLKFERFSLVFLVDRADQARWWGGKCLPRPALLTEGSVQDETGLNPSRLEGTSSRVQSRLRYSRMRVGREPSGNETKTALSRKGHLPTRFTKFGIVRLQGRSCGFETAPIDAGRLGRGFAVLYLHTELHLQTDN